MPVLVAHQSSGIPPWIHFIDVQRGHGLSHAQGGAAKSMWQTETVRWMFFMGAGR